MLGKHLRKKGNILTSLRTSNCISKAKIWILGTMVLVLTLLVACSAGKERIMFPIRNEHLLVEFIRNEHHISILAQAQYIKHQNGNQEREHDLNDSVANL